MRLFPNELPAPGRSITSQCFRQFLTCVRLCLHWRIWTVFLFFYLVRANYPVFLSVFMQRYTIQHTFTKRKALFVFKSLTGARKQRSYT